MAAADDAKSGRNPPKSEAGYGFRKGSPSINSRTSTAAVQAQPGVTKLMSSEHFSVDGTLIEAWASNKSFKPKDGSGDEPPSGSGRNAELDFKGRKCSNETHALTTDPEARLYRKGAGMEAKLAFLGHALMENRSCLIVNACLTLADGQAERTAALAMIERLADRPTGVTLGADKGYDARVFVNEPRAMNVRPHVAQNTNRRSSAIDGRTTRHPGYAVSQRIRKRIEEAFTGRPGRTDRAWRPRRTKPALVRRRTGHDYASPGRRVWKCRCTGHGQYTLGLTTIGTTS